MKKIYLISFTAAGVKLEKQLLDVLEEYSPGNYDVKAATRYRHGRDAAAGSAPEDGIRFAGEGFSEWTGAAMEDADIVLFIGATGIAVRAIAPFVRDKLKDPAVLVMDEKGQYVISLLSGHVGGANEFAALIAARTGALPVITTATDINGAFSADLFAKEQHLTIANRTAIAPVSTKAIEGKPVRLSIEGFPPKGEADVVVCSGPVKENTGFFRPETLVLCPKRFAVGMGCKKGIPLEKLEAVFLEALEMIGAALEDVGALCSIDVKSEEPGLLALSAKYRLPFLTFSADVLREVPGTFSASGFVNSQVGVDNVCERSAVAAAGAGSRLVLKKQMRDGVTVAAAECAARG